MASSAGGLTEEQQRELASIHRALDDITNRVRRGRTEKLEGELSIDVLLADVRRARLRVTFARSRDRATFASMMTPHDVPASGNVGGSSEGVVKHHHDRGAEV
jgi:hypothetical protein